MKRLFNTLFMAAAAFGLLFMVGCGRPAPQATAPRPVGKLAIAGFTNPTKTMDLMAGYLPEEDKPVKPEVLANLDVVLQDTLNKHGVLEYVPASVTRQCQNVVVFESGGVPRMSAFKYWLGVGKCMAADYLLVPQVIYWQDRKGGEMGVENPASVVLDIFLINVKEESLLRAHYAETQQALSENILDARKFFSRGGKWITAQQLATEGIDQKLLELGL